MSKDRKDGMDHVVKNVWYSFLALLLSGLPTNFSIFQYCFNWDQYFVIHDNLFNYNNVFQTLAVYFFFTFYSTLEHKMLLSICIHYIIHGATLYPKKSQKYLVVFRLVIVQGFFRRKSRMRYNIIILSTIYMICKIS